MKGPHSKGMLLLTLLLFFTAVPDQSLGQDDDEEEEEEDREGLNVGSGILPVDQQLIVDKHNEMRRNVQPTARNMLKMSWNETVGASSRKWAEQCKPSSGPVEDRTFDGVLCGQSIFQSNYLFSWSEILEYWQNKSRYFKYGVGPTVPEQNIYGYTQAIWYRSYQVGCGISICPENQFRFMFVCQYCPTGNIQSQIATPYKEGPPCGDCPKHCDNKLCTNPCKYVDIYFHCPDLKKHVGCKRANKKGHCMATCKCKTRIK